MLGRGRMRRWLVVLLLSIGLVGGCAAPVSAPRPSVDPPAPSVSRAPESSPELPNFASELESAISVDQTRALDNIESVLVSVQGRLVGEHYRHEATPTTHTHVWSVAKSVVSTLAGIAIAEGKIDDLDQTVAELLPQHRRQMSAAMSRATLRQLLTMSSGLTDQIYVEQTSASDDSLRTLLALPLDTERFFSYSNVSAHLVAAIVAERVGMPLLSYARSRLFTPLGIETSVAYTGEETALQPSPAFLSAGFAWATTSDGRQHGCCMLKLTGRDMIKIGRLHVQDGRWNGRRLLPAGWVREATAASEANADYGLMWWRQSVDGRDAYAALGAFGQMILVVPKLSAVITVSSRRAGDSSVEGDKLLAMIERVIVPMIE